MALFILFLITSFFGPHPFRAFHSSCFLSTFITFPWNQSSYASFSFIIRVIYILQVFTVCWDDCRQVKKGILVNALHLQHFYLLICYSSSLYFVYWKISSKFFMLCQHPKAHFSLDAFQFLWYYLLTCFSKRHSFYWMTKTLDLTQDKLLEYCLGSWKA